LQGKVAVITGGASGIGQACAVRFAQEGADIVVGDLADGEATIKLVEQVGRKAIFVRTDTTIEADCDGLIERVVSEFGRVDIGMASAGIATAAGPSNVETRQTEVDAGHVVGISTEVFRKVLEVNAIGVMMTDRELARQMLAQGTVGSIVNIASSAARIPLAGATPYCISKAGV
jgi:NAD(P)-dependent dehydrogenase (short-subunit alcohol dehydrogenase family)